MNTKQEVLAVDGDIIAYKTAAVCEDHFEGACQSIIDTTIRDIVNSTGIEHLRIYLSGSNNYRKDIAVTKPYKGNRATMVHPQYLNACKQYLIDEYKAYIVEGYEADDAIATDMTLNNAIHCGIDKDILQVAGRHYNYVKKEWQTVSEEEAIITLYRQVLMGDTSDNVPGLPKVGEKTAEKAIQDFESAREDCIAMYKEVCEDRLPGVDYMEYFNEQFNLISMRTNVELDFEKITMFIKKDGFEEVEGDFTGIDDEPKL